MDSFENKLRSVIAYRQTVFGNAVGKWVGKTSTEMLEWQIHVGFTTSYSEAEQLA